jgi:anti-sigma factor (TIGR02949 family)
MNCTAARKYIYAFADGQLDVHVNCEVLDHLKMCPQCGRLADEQQSLRRALAQQLNATHAPAGLREKIAMGLCTPAPMSRKWSYSDSNLRRLLIPLLTAAAAIALAVFVIRDAFFPHEETLVSVTQNAKAVSLVAQVHDACCAHPLTHQSKELPADLSQLGAAISEHYHASIAALAPNLSGHGFDFESANFCGVRNCPGSGGGHLIYLAKKKDKRLSFFSVPRWDCLDKCGQQGIPNSDDVRWYEVDGDLGQKLSILAWHNDATTYICCGPLPADEIKSIVHDVRTAMVMFDKQVRLALLHRGD